MVNQPVTPEMSRWLADLTSAFAWTKEPGMGEAINTGFAAGSLDRMPDREKYDALIARWQREKAAIERQAIKQKQRRWGPKR